MSKSDEDRSESQKLLISLGLMGPILVSVEETVEQKAESWV
jgi:hypothetical protein